MTDSMIEKVARAIYDSVTPMDDPEFSDLSETNPEREHYAYLARAAIEAMMEPTDDMCWAFNDAFPVPQAGDPVETPLRMIAPVIYKVMIQAALEVDND